MASSSMSPDASKNVLNNKKSPCIVCSKHESIDSTTTGGIELPWNFLDALNLVWPSLVEDDEKTGRQTPLKGFKDGRFTEIPTICQQCADRVHGVHYFKRLLNRYLEELQKSIEEAKREDNKTLQTERTIRGILNKITNNSLYADILTSQLVDILPFFKNGEDNNSDNLLIMNKVASLIFDKAAKESFYGPAYARLTNAICKLSSKFREIILDLCLFRFQQNCVQKSDETEGEDKRQRAFGILIFIQDLYNFKFKIIPTKIIVECVETLVHPPINQWKLECVYNFLATEKHEQKIPFGEIIDVQLKALPDSLKRGENVEFIPEDGWMDKIFVKLKDFSKSHQFSGRIRCLLTNLVELRGNGWTSRAITKITEVPWGKPAVKRILPNEEPDLTMQYFERKARSILNKVNLNNVTLENDILFSRLFFKFLKSPFWFRNEVKIELQIVKAAEMLFEKGVNEPMYSNAYAKIVQDISRFRRKHRYSRNFPKIGEIVVTRCIDEISKISSADESDVQLGPVETKVKREKVLAVVKFIEELYKLEVFSVKNMGTCMQLLFNGPVNELKVECMQKLLMCESVANESKEMVCYGEFLAIQLIVFRTAGKDGEDDLRWIDEMFGNMKKFAEDTRFGMRLRSLLVNLVELRENVWKHKSRAMAVSNEGGVKNEANGGQRKGRWGDKVPDGNWRN